MIIGLDNTPLCTSLHCHECCVLLLCKIYILVFKSRLHTAYFPRWQTIFLLREAIQKKVCLYLDIVKISLTPSPLWLEVQGLCVSNTCFFSSCNLEFSDMSTSQWAWAPMEWCFDGMIKWWNRVMMDPLHTEASLPSRDLTQLARDERTGSSFSIKYRNPTPSSDWAGPVGVVQILCNCFEMGI